MAHQQTQDGSTPFDLGLEDSIRRSWSAGSRVRILSSASNDWVSAHIVTIHKDWLYCLLDDGDTKKVDRYDISVQPFAANTSSGTTTGGGGEDDDDIVWFFANSRRLIACHRLVHQHNDISFGSKTEWTLSRPQCPMTLCPNRSRVRWPTSTLDRFSRIRSMR